MGEILVNRTDSTEFKIASLTCTEYVLLKREFDQE